MESRFKVCSKCGEGKPRTEFYKHRRKKDGLNSQCKTCRNQYNKKFYQENREYRREHQKQYYKENREHKLEYERQYRQQNRERVLECYKRYSQKNREKRAALEAKHRALKREAVPDALANCPEEKERLMQIYKLRGLLTGATGIAHHVDHIWPLSKGGPHWSGNLQIITAEENLSKGDTLCEDTARVIQESLNEYCSARQ